jgi:hypothetical protein
LFQKALPLQKMFYIFCFKKGKREAFETKNVKHFLSMYQAFFVSKKKNTSYFCQAFFVLIALLLFYYVK